MSGVLETQRGTGNSPGSEKLQDSQEIEKYPSVVVWVDVAMEHTLRVSLESISWGGDHGVVCGGMSQIWRHALEKREATGSH